MAQYEANKKYRVAFRNGKETVIIANRNRADDYTGKITTTSIINQAVEKMYGPRCYWWADNGVGPEYGQVMEGLKATRNNSNPGSCSVTYRIRVDIHPVAKQN